jgi:hypothetical protein
MRVPLVQAQDACATLSGAGCACHSFRQQDARATKKKNDSLRDPVTQGVKWRSELSKTVCEGSLDRRVTFWFQINEKDESDPFYQTIKLY